MMEINLQNLENASYLFQGYKVNYYYIIDTNNKIIIIISYH